eukprot:m.413692 g.413692  ORF g.413692 m.413692 type:complete len:93 (+) comp21266_c0_seq11:2483-2761(+)
MHTGTIQGGGMARTGGTMFTAGHRQSTIHMVGAGRVTPTAGASTTAAEAAVVVARTGVIAGDGTPDGHGTTMDDAGAAAGDNCASIGTPDLR